jgi:hypothetical protein
MPKPQRNVLRNVATYNALLRGKKLFAKMLRDENSKLFFVLLSNLLAAYLKNSVIKFVAVAIGRLIAPFRNISLYDSLLPSNELGTELTAFRPF